MRQAGFTLIECLIALVVLAMLAAAVVPFFNRLASGRLHAERDGLAIDAITRLNPQHLRMALKGPFQISEDPPLYLRAVELRQRSPEPLPVSLDPQAFRWAMPSRRWVVATVTVGPTADAYVLASAVVLAPEDKESTP